MNERACLLCANERQESESLWSQCRPNQPVHLSLHEISLNQSFVRLQAQFPGFRKGQIPPYAMPQIVNFAIQEGLVKTIEQAVAAYGLTALSGSDGEVEILEDVQEMCKGYKDGESLKFTATFKAAMEESEEEDEPADDSVIDAEVVVEE